MNITKYLQSKIESLTPDQKGLFDKMQLAKRLQVCIPTGAGKGYLMMVDLLNQLVSSDKKIFVISSHRLLLNTQHLNDIFDVLSPILGKVGFIFVGSSKYNSSKFQENPDFNRALMKKKLSYDDIISSTTSKNELEGIVDFHLKNDRKVVILTTYHSAIVLKDLDIDDIYFDEAHTLATIEESSLFQNNFNELTFERGLFFTATPKDCMEDTEAFLMNNKDVFGDRIGLTFKECVEKGYIVKPVVHIALPSNFDPSLEFKSVKNMTKFVEETYQAHSKFIEENSFAPDKIQAKILIKCPSVDDMWDIYKELLGKVKGVRICAGASRNPYSSFNYFIDDKGIANRNVYLEELQAFDENEGAIVLHYDTMSEGINVSGFTGTEFLGGKLPTLPKTLQNTGRSTRVVPYDRDRVRSGEITAADYTKWVKPFCAVIIPFWDKESEFTTNELARQIKSLRDNFGYDPVFYVSLGSDIAKAEKEEDMDKQNEKDKRNKKSEIIDEIRNEIEELDKLDLSMAEANRINNMSIEEWFEYANS